MNWKTFTIFIILNLLLLFMSISYTLFYSNFAKEISKVIREKEDSKKRTDFKELNDAYNSIEYFLALVKQYELEPKITEKLCKNKN